MVHRKPMYLSLANNDYVIDLILEIMKNKLSVILIINFVLLSLNSFSQGVGINNDGAMPVAGTMLDVKGATDDNTTYGMQIKNSSGNAIMVVRSEGNVGIGTTAPGDKLHVEGNLYFGTSSRTVYTQGAGDLNLQSNTGAVKFSTLGGSERMRVSSNGNVGIGTNSPSGKLDIRPNAGTASVYFGSSADSYPRIYMGGTSASVAGVINRITTGATLYFGENGDAGGYELRGTGNINIGTNRLYISSGGNVGIGTTTTGRKLTVSGDLLYNNNAIIASDASAGNIDHLWHDDGGNAWHFVSDAGYKANGNSTLYAGSFSAAGNTVWHAGNEGAGSGLDADVLDGITSGSFLRSDAKDQMSVTAHTADANDYTLELYSPSTGDPTNELSIRFHQGSNYWYQMRARSGGFRFTAGNTGAFTNIYAANIYSSNNLVWHAGNDGGGSGLDADLLDGINSDKFFRLDEVEVITGGVGGSEGGEFRLDGPASGTSIAGDVVVDVNGNNLRIFESGGANRGFYLPLTSAAAGAASTFQFRVTGTCPAGSSVRAINSNGTVTCETDDNSGGDITGVTAGTGLTGGGTTGTPTLGIHTATDDNITNRAPASTGLGSGFYQTSSATTAEGWPENASWFHLMNVQHSNTGNNYAMQLAADYYDQQLYFRSTANNGAQAWGEVWHSLSDGAGSGLDADLLDGVSSANFLRSDASDDYSNGVLRTYSATGIDVTNTGQINGLQVYQPTANADALMTFHISGDYAVHFGLDGNTNDLTVGGWSMGANKYKIWHAGNDGAGSGLDADLLDGVSSGSFLRSDVDDVVQGTLDFDPTTTIGSTGLRGFQMSYAGWNAIALDGGTSTKSVVLHYGASADNVLRFGRYGNNFGSWEANVTTLDIDNGNWYTQGSIEADNRIYADNGVHIRGDWLRVDGNNGIYFQSHGGGFYMSDATWIRTYNNKSFYHNTGVMRTDGTFQVGGSGGTLNVPNGGNFAYRTNVLFANTAGNVGIGTTAPTQKLDVNGRVKSLGINETSDVRFKENITTLSNALDKVKSLRGVNYLWKTEEFPEKGFVEGKQLGVIAQEVEKVIPEVVITDAKGYKSVEYSKMVALLIEGMKDLSAISEKQQQMIDDLKNENKIIRAENEAIKLDHEQVKKLLQTYVTK